MRDTLFPRWQGAFLAVFLLADGLYLQITPQNIFSIFVSTIIFAIIAFLYLKILEYFEIRDFEAFCLKTSKFIGIPLLVIVGIISILIFLKSGIRLSTFWHKTAFPSIPPFLTIFVLFFVALRAGKRGRTAVAMWAYPTAFFCFTIVIISIFITIPTITPEYAVNVARHANLNINSNFLYIIPALLLCTQTKKLSTTKHCVFGILFGGFILCLIALRAYLVLGSACSVLQYPSFLSAGIFSVGDFLQRGEVIFGCAIALCEVVRTALMLTLAITCFKSAFKFLRKFKI